MRIGIDIDDTLLNIVNSMLKYADKYDIEVLGRKGSNGNIGLIKNRYYLKSLYNWTDEEKFNFFEMYYKNVLEECTLKENADKVCQKFKEDGNEIYFISARLGNVKDCNTEQITKNTFEKNNIPYTKLIINAKDKITISKELNIDLFIEDSYETCSQLAEIGINSILITTPLNDKIDTGNIPRANNWDEIYEQYKKYYKNN